MKSGLNKKYGLIAKYTIVTFSVCLLLASAVIYNRSIFDFAGKLVKALSPVILGCIIAYLINPLMKFFEKQIKLLDKRNKLHKNALRGISVFITMLIFVLLITLLITAVIPEVIRSIEKIFINSRTYIDKLIDYANSFLKNNPQINEVFLSRLDEAEANIFEYISKLQPRFERMILNISGGAVSFLTFIKDFVIGIVISVYLLAGKEKFSEQIKKIFSAFLSQDGYKKTMTAAGKTDKALIKYFSAKALDSFLVGVILLIILSLFRIPYAALVSVIIGIFNMIPFFGPFIGGVPSALLILAENPGKCLVFLIILVVVQQLDGNFIDPKISGQALGLPPFWIIFAVLAGGGLFGFAGMVLSVPVFTVFYDAAGNYIDARIMKKKLLSGSDARSATAEPPDT